MIFISSSVEDLHHEIQNKTKQCYNIIQCALMIR